MYCHLCGKEIEAGSTFCPYCGTRIKAAPPEEERKADKDEFFDAPPAPPAYQQPYPDQQSPAPQTRTNSFALIGFILSFFFSIGGLICSIMGLRQCNQTGEGGRGLAIAGIVISAVSLFLSVVLTSSIFRMLFWL